MPPPSSSTDPRTGRPHRAFKAFLSHSYKSPAVNLFFFRLFARTAAVQFEADAARGATNVTRLERMLRGSDAFIGIYPFSRPADQVPTTEDLRHESQYFRLELELAARAGRPALVFSDERFRSVLSCPETIRQVTYDPQELSSGDESPREQEFENEFASFAERVFAFNRYRAALAPGRAARAKVGLLVPPDGIPGGYDAQAVATVTALLAGNEYETTLLRWPPVLDAGLHTTLAQLDWLVVDVGPAVAATGLAGFFHAQFIPMLRLRQVQSASEPPTEVERCLFGGVEVGYPKDILHWTSIDELRGGLDARLARIRQPVQRITTYERAVQYFTTAALRKETVFVSYSGKDAKVAADIIAALKQTFQEVFDYRDVSSITPGQPWLNEIFRTISTTALGVALLSPDYFQSGNCEHELEAMVARRDERKLELLPVKLVPDAPEGKKLELPSYLANLHYLRYWNYPNAAEAVAAVVTAFDKARRAAGG